MRRGNVQRDARAGHALATAMLMILALSAIVTALFTMTTAEYMRSREWRDETRSFYVAEAGMNEAFAALVGAGPAGVAALAYPRTLGQGEYSVLMTLGEDDPAMLDNRVLLRSIGSEGRATVGIEVIAWAVPNGDYLYAAFGDEGVLLNSNVTIDSFDSNDGPYAGPMPAGALANVGSNGDVELESNTEIWGDVIPGPSGVLIDSAPNSDVSGATSSAEDLVALDPITVPAIASTGPLTVGGATSLGPGAVHRSTVTVTSGGVLTIVGPATVVIDDFELNANSDLVIDSTGGPVEIFGTGDFELKSNSRVTTTGQQARDCAVYLSGDTGATPPAVIDLSSNSDFTGTIYAPAADLVLASNFHLFGSLVGASIELASNAQLHFDEDLLYEDGVLPEFEQLAWQVISKQEL